MTLTQQDLEQIKRKGISPETIETQLNNFRQGFPYMKLIKPATINDGIYFLDNTVKIAFLKDYESQLDQLKITKFVPASGAASRMFKKLFEFLYMAKQTGRSVIDDAFMKKTDFDAVKVFFDNITKFAFYDSLKEALQKQGYEMADLLAKKAYPLVLETLLNKEGLNYGNQPKGLLLFHQYDEKSRTPVEEHLTEGAQYAKDAQGVVRLHFTVSPEHRADFEAHIIEVKNHYQKIFDVQYEITFSVQKPSTDTIAVDLNDQPFRLNDNSILFRPGGHGALIENLNDIDSDLIFIKNIDNVVPDRLKAPTITYKKALAGLLLHYQKRVFAYLRLLSEQKYDASYDLTEEIGHFIEDELCLLPSENFQPKTKSERIDRLFKRLNRPIRVCGMVRNQGDPGGGPFWAVNNDDSVSLQVVETSQIDPNDSEQQEILGAATHFNPVDVLCAVRDYKGQKFDLTQYIDPQTGFIARKSKDGRDLKALERPGLWNGSMSDWITIFAEVPVETFNPVKAVNDLLYDQHQA